MFVFAVLLVLFPIIDISYSIGCASLPPGMDRLSHGIDITSFDLFPADLTESNGLVRNIFDFTCDKHKKWANPFIPSLVYDMPDQVEAIVAIPGGILDMKTEIAMSYKDDKVAKSSKLGLGFLGGLFSFSHSSSKSRESIIANNRVLTTVAAHVSATEVQMIPYWSETMGIYMKQFHDQFLPNTYQENPAKYQEFLSTFGTHFFTTARFGGLMKIEIETDLQYANTITAKNLETQAGISFLEKLSLSGGHTKSSAKNDLNFIQHSSITESYYGGNANLIKTGLTGFQSWWNSAQRMPWIFGGTMATTLSFLPNGPKKNALTTALTVKLDYAYLDELRNSLTLLKTHNPYIDMVGANALFTRIDGLRTQIIPDHPGVAKLGLDIDTFIYFNKIKGPPCILVVKTKMCTKPKGVLHCTCPVGYRAPLNIY